MQFLDRLSLFIARVTRWTVIVMAAVMIVSLVLQIIFRYLVGSSLVWSEELALFMFTWIILLTGSLGVREGFHVRLVLITNILPPVAKKAVEVITHLIAGSFGALVLFSGYRYLDSTLGQVSAAVRYPIEALHAAAPVCGALIILHTLANLGAMVRGGNREAGHE